MTTPLGVLTLSEFGFKDNPDQFMGRVANALGPSQELVRVPVHDIPVMGRQMLFVGSVVVLFHAPLM